MRKFLLRCRRQLQKLGLLDQQSYGSRFQSRPSIRQLEERRVLNAEFMYAMGDSLSLDDFTNSNGTLNDESITISSDATGTLFTLSEGVWSGTDMMGQVELLNSNTTLKLFSTAANGLTNGITVNDSMSVGLDVKRQ